MQWRVSIVFTVLSTCPVPTIFGFVASAVPHSSPCVCSGSSSSFAGLHFCCLSYSVHNRIINTLHVSIRL